MKTMAKIAVLVALGSAACGEAPTPRFPRTFLSESQDEWLETHCASRGVVETTNGEFNDRMYDARANFGEVVSYTKYLNPKLSPITVKMFACDAKPRWYAADSLDKPEDL